MAPLHHHFELGGWDEEKITLRFWIVGILAGLLGVTLFLASINCAPLMPMTTPVDIDALTLDGVRAGALDGRPVTVLGLARSGIALARFLHDAGAAGDRLRRAHGGGRCEAAIEAAGRPRRRRCASGPTWTRRRPGRTRRSSPPRPRSRPTIRPPSRASGPRSRRSSRRARRATPRRPALGQRVRPVPAPLPGPHDRGHRDQGQDDHLVARSTRSSRRTRSTRRVLGGNIGTPLVERLPELTPDHRVVVELSELQLPALSRGTTVAVYTNVTSDHLDRHGSLDAYRRVKRRLAELVDPDGALVLNLEDPVVGGYAGLGTAPVVLYRDDRPVPGRPRRAWTDGSCRPPWSGCRWRAAGIAQAGPGGAIMPVDELGIPGRHNVSNALAAIAVGLLFGVAPDAIRRAAAAFTGVEHRLQPVGPGRRRPVRERLPGHPAGRGHRGPARVPAAGRADRRRPGQGRGPPRAGARSPPRRRRRRS